MGKILRHKTDSGAEYCTMEDDSEHVEYKAPAWKGLHFDDEQTLALQRHRMFAHEDIKKGAELKVVGVTPGGLLVGRI